MAISGMRCAPPEVLRDGGTQMALPDAWTRSWSTNFGSTPAGVLLARHELMSNKCVRSAPAPCYSNRGDVGSPFINKAWEPSFINIAWESRLKDWPWTLQGPTSGKQYCLMVGCYFSKCLKCFHIPDHKATMVARKLVYEIVALYGAICELHSDQGTTFGLGETSEFAM